MSAPTDKMEILRNVLTVMKLSNEIALSGDEKAAINRTARAYLRGHLGLDQKPEETDEEIVGRMSAGAGA
jgi:hypothetical protein